MSASDFDLERQKTLARQAALKRRAGQDPALGAAMADFIIAQSPPRRDAIVAGFWPLEHEIDTRPVLQKFAERGFDVCLPVTPRQGEVLTFRRWQPGDTLVPGRAGTLHTEGEELIPNYILVPLLAFDNLGRRLGYGGGYYDRTFFFLPKAFRIGCAFSVQEAEKVPAGPMDVNLHAVATELGIRRFGTA